jgi:hypothetical protein
MLWFGQFKIVKLIWYLKKVKPNKFTGYTQNCFVDTHVVLPPSYGVVGTYMDSGFNQMMAIVHAIFIQVGWLHSNRFQDA